jgi:hypothetical protein
VHYIRLNLITITTANHMHHFPFSYIKLKIIEHFLSTYNYNLICSCIHTIVHINWYFGNHSPGFLIKPHCSTCRISPYIPPDHFLLNDFHNLPHFPRPQISNLSAVTHFLLSSSITQYTSLCNLLLRIFCWTSISVATADEK